MASRRFNKAPPTPKGQSRETCCNSLSFASDDDGFCLVYAIQCFVLYTELPTFCCKAQSSAGLQLVHSFSSVSALGGMNVH